MQCRGLKRSCAGVGPSWILSIGMPVFAKPKEGHDVSFDLGFWVSAVSSVQLWA